jgi:catechol 2,3-dioxygenase-like lactoylglutathione lyase family enzyme
MTEKFRISGLGHVGIWVADLDRSIKWYTEILGLTLTGRWPTRTGGEIVFLRFNENHHDLVLMPKSDLTAKSKPSNENRLQHIAMMIEGRHEWLKALAQLKRSGVAITRGPYLHGFEGGTGPGTSPGGSGSRSFYFEDPDGNSLELYTDMMKVPDGQPFPPPDYEDLIDEVIKERLPNK